MRGQQRNSPMADPIFGSKYGLQNGVQNWITFSFLLLGLCWAPFWDPDLDPKVGSAIGDFLLLPAEVLQANLRRTSMSVSVNTLLFLSVLPTLYSRAHVSAGFLDPVLGAMMKQVCWHSRRSKAYPGLPEAHMAGATVEETAFEDVNMWQAPVSQKPPLMGT